MSITFPTFIDKEIVTPEKLNDFVQALEAKFAAGLSSAEIVWPLDAGGDLQMGDYNITGGESIWGIYNAAQYADDWDSCLSDGAGGCIVIPPNTTVTMDASAMTGSSLSIKGSGPSSILQLEAGATGGFALRNSSSGFSLKLENLTVDGAEIAAQKGIVLQGADDVVIHNVLFLDFEDSAIHLTSTGGVGCSDVKITDCTFDGGAEYQIEGDDVSDLVIKGNTFKTAAKTAIMLEASGATADILRVGIEDNNFFGCVGDVISVLGADGSHNAPQSHIRVAGNKANNGNSFKVGSDTAKVQYVAVENNISNAATGNALEVSAQYGTVSGNVLPNAGGDAIDLLASKYLVVSGNNCHSATDVGVRFADTIGCQVDNNLTVDCGTAFVVNTTATNPTRHFNNSDDTPEVPGVNTWHCDSASFIIPANTLKVGDVLQIHAVWTDGVGGGTQGVQVDGNYVASYVGVGTDDEAGALATVNVLGATTIDALGSCWADGGTNGNNGGPLSTGHDLAADWVVKVNGANIANASMFATLHRGVSI